MSPDRQCSIFGYVGLSKPSLLPARVAVKSVKCQTHLREILTLFPEIKTFILLLSWGQRVGHLSNSKWTLTSQKLVRLDWQDLISSYSKETTNHYTFTAFALYNALQSNAQLCWWFGWRKKRRSLFETNHNGGNNRNTRCGYTFFSPCGVGGHPLSQSTSENIFSSHSKESNPQ